MAFSWGRNDLGQLGLGRRERYAEFPSYIKSLKEKKIKMIAAGEHHTLFLADTGEVYSCGFNEQGELGLGNMPPI
jgi:alpha-tubulin suppressor-like RCC1 family protein